ncbi:MAG: tRNA uridine-5-carboxymethylaminomethyl(34) synthesis GTPase MnmE [Geminicoccaceae bacterium]
MTSDTIFAPATPRGKSGVAIVRVSGPDACLALAAVAGVDESVVPAPGRLVRRRLARPDGTAIDDALVVRFAAPRSFTGEDVVEFQLHGGTMPTALLLDALADLPGLRPAEPGEFTRRAFDRGKLDLTAVEGLADLIDAETKTQADQALRLLNGELGRLYAGWRDQLLSIMARIEAEIDFAADQDLDETLAAEAMSSAKDLMAAIDRHLADRRGERLRSGFRIALIGAVNAGKSTLLNLLARREVAIVTPVPGTTRDPIEAHLDLGGLPVTLIDTAGLRDTADLVEREGIRRARETATQADFRLLLVDPTVPGPPTLPDADLTVRTKADLLSEREDVEPDALSISAHTGAGIDVLLERLERAAAEALTGGSEPAFTRTRHRIALESARKHLAHFVEGGHHDIACAGEDLRLAGRDLARLIGAVEVDDVLDQLFASFCIGK